MFLSVLVKDAGRKQFYRAIHHKPLHMLRGALYIKQGRGRVYLPVGMGEGSRRSPWHTMLRPTSVGASPIIWVSSSKSLPPQRVPPSTASRTSLVPLWLRFIQRHWEGHVPPPSISRLYRRGYVLKLCAKLQNKSKKIKLIIVTI